MSKLFKSKPKVIIMALFTLTMAIYLFVGKTFVAEAYTNLATLTLDNMKSAVGSTADDYMYDGINWQISGCYKDDSGNIYLKQGLGGACFYRVPSESTSTGISYSVTFGSSISNLSVSQYGGSFSQQIATSGTSFSGTVDFGDKDLVGGNNNAVRFNFHGDNNNPLLITSFSLTIHAGDPNASVTITKGTGIKSVYLSTNSNATSGSESGTKFDSGNKVYGFAELAKGYKAKSGWTRVSGTADTEGAKYRIGDKTVGSSAVDFGTISADLISYTIEYTLNGGSVSGNPTSYNVTSNAITLKNPTKTGYTFKGWTGSNGTTPQTSVSIAKGSTGNKTYTANWDVSKYTITYKDAGNSNFSGTHESGYPTQHTYGTATTLKSATKTGYTFGGWFTNSNCTGTAVTSLGATAYTSNITLYAKWTPNEYTVTFDQTIGTGGTESETVIYGTKTLSITPPSKAGYYFLGYYYNDVEYVDFQGSQSKDWDIASNTTLTAKWEARDYKITYIKNGGTVDGTGLGWYTNGGTTISQTQEINLPTATKTGYTFDGWTTTKTGVTITDKTKLTIDADVYGDFEVSAQFTPKVYSITFDNGVGEGGIDSTTVSYNEMIADVAVPSKDGYTFQGYYDQPNGAGKQYIDKDGHGSNNWDKDVDSATTLYAYMTMNMTYEVVGFEGDYDGIAKRVTVEMTDPTSTNYVKFSNDNGATYTLDYDNSPSYTNVGEYTVYYQIKAIVGDVHYTPVEGTATIIIKKVDRTNLESVIDESNDFYNSIKDISSYSEVSNALKDAINAANTFNANDNVSLAEINEAIGELQIAYDNSRANVGILKINAIQPVACTDACKALIDEAFTYYEGLTTIQQQLVNSPDDKYAELVHDKDIYDNVKNFYDLVDAIGDPSLTAEYKGQIDAARTAYNNLDEAEEKSIVAADVLNDLINAEKAYEAMTLINAIKDAENYTDFANATKAAKDLYDTLSADQLALIPEEFHNLLADVLVAEETIGKIDSIGDVSHTDACKALIDEANDSYAALTDAQKALVQGVNYTELVKANLDYDNVDESINKINNIGEFEFTDECKAKIDEARAIYDELTADQKAILPDDILKTLEDDEHAYNAMNLIKNIGEVKNNDESRALVKVAREYLDELTDDQLDLVDPAFIKIIEDDEAALSAMDKINNIGKVEYTKDCKAKIDAARTSYDGLTDDQKAIVNANNYKVLTDAEKAYNDTDNAHKKIDDIAAIKLTDECKAKIDEARATYDALTAEEKAIMPAEQYNTLVNAEKAYGALVEIYNIGEVSYDSESNAKIKTAREAYNSLSDDQKKLIDNNDLKVLTDKETDFSSTDKAATIWGVILLILSIIALGTGCYFLYLVTRKNNKNNTIKASSSVLPLVILTSYFTTGSYLAFYIIISLAAVVWGTVLVIYLLKKKGIIMASTADGEIAINNVAIQENDNANNFAPVESVTSNTENEEIQDDDASEDDVVETTKDASGNIFKIQYISSFTAKLIQSSDELKKQYSELRKEVLSYNGTKSKTTWHFDTISYGKAVVLRFGIRGKTLCVYYALNYADFENSKYKLENITSKKHSSAPCLYRIKNDRRFDYAKELIEILAKKYDLVKEDKKIEDIMPPYEDRDTLVSKGLIKKLEVKLTSNNKKITEITVDEANKAMSSDAALSCIIKDNDSKIHVGKKEIVNISVLEEKFNDGDTVNIESLIEKGIINSKVGYVKLLAGGKLDKKLNVELQDYSIEAVKMIILLGGTVKKVR